ncbi:MAG: proprotein convertase P-domain-containing protein [Gammaproteobacteria bacterium]|nr:proprotein convertase P-domain-containing protein [Gammaproteobacteria bacterium]
MAKKYDSYTYRAGKQVKLRKSQDEIVIRQRPEQIKTIEDGIPGKYKQISSHSTRITTPANELENVMTRARAVAPTHHAYYEENGDTAFQITDRFFARFKHPPTDEQLSAFIARYALILCHTYTEQDFLFQLTNHTGMNPVKLVVKLNEEDDQIESAEHDLNHLTTKYAVPIPTDPDYFRQWHLHTNYNHQDYDHRACSMCEEAWQVLDNVGSASVTVAISDDGCRLDHSDFDSLGKFTAWGYFSEQRLITQDDIDADPSAMYQAGANHGTSCAGVVAGEIDATLTVGAAPGCRLLPIKFESSGPSLYISSSRMLKALDYIADKADVMSNSWGGVPVNVWPTIVVTRITELAQTGGPRGKGIVFLWAAGNENCPINHNSNQDVPYSTGIGWQGDTPVWVGVETARTFENNLVGVPGLAHVAAIASTARRSHYSNYGTGIAICAPTSNVHTYSRMQVRGLGITTTTGASPDVTFFFGGTSSATPLVAGIAALTISANPNLTAEEVLSILKQSASKNLDFTDYPKTPTAPYDPDTSWDVSPIAPFSDGAFVDNGNEDGSWSPWFGHGRIDARAAVSAALNLASHDGAANFSQDSVPNISIPDNNADGISNIINCGKDFNIETVKVNVDVTHTYAGDLKVSLISPSGTTVVLHDRFGGSTHDIHSEFDFLSVPLLNNFSGETSRGAWTLWVQDLANVDVGRLQRWSLQLTGRDVANIEAQESPGLIIPDNQSPGIERTLNVAAASNINSLTLDLDITHTYIGDLTVRLIAPDGTVVTLHDRIGDNSQNLIRSYSNANTPALLTLVGRAAMGDWKLNVSDHADIDQGKLNFWRLTIA